MKKKVYLVGFSYHDFGNYTHHHPLEDGYYVWVARNSVTEIPEGAKVIDFEDV